MANSASNLDLINASQAGKETTANAFFDASSQAVLYGRRAAGAGGLNWPFYGGNVLVGGVPTFIANGVKTVPASAHVFVEAGQDDGQVYTNVLGWTPGRAPLYELQTSADAITSWTDRRILGMGCKAAFALAVTGDTAFQFDASNSDIVALTGAPAADFSVLLAKRAWVYIVRNATGRVATLNCGGAQTVTIAAGAAAHIFTDGTEVYRLP